MKPKEIEALQRYANGENLTHDVLRHLVKRLLEKHKDVQERLEEEERDWERQAEEIEKCNEEYQTHMSGMQGEIERLQRAVDWYAGEHNRLQQELANSGQRAREALRRDTNE
jgi:peptidoglycan hydrolase CwlO-like protein